MKKLGLIANMTKPRAAEVLKQVVQKGCDLGFEMVAEKSTARLVHGVKAVTPERLLNSVEAIVALGGDGTMLRAVRELGGRDVPVMGVNIGGLGFLTSVAENEIGQAMKSLSRDAFEMSVRAVAEPVVERKGKILSTYRALNDVVISSGPSNRIVTLDVSIGGDRGTSYVCDGLIVSTPTGSTGHSLSAGGPILAPDTPAFVISLICPHTLSSRPLVVPDHSEICIRVVEAAGRIRLSVDGQVGRMLAEGDVVRVSRSDRSVRFLHLPGHSYFSVLRQKLHWSGSYR